LVDALASGASGGNPMEVQVLSSAPLFKVHMPQDQDTNILFDLFVYLDIKKSMIPLALVIPRILKTILKQY
jgi:hypothetical protein